MYRHLDKKHILIGVCLSICNSFFDKRIPSLKAYLRGVGISEAVIYRLRPLVEGRILKFLEGRLPGRRNKLRDEKAEALEVAKKVNGLLQYLLQRVLFHKKKRKNLIFSPSIKEMIIVAREELKESHGVSYERFSQLVGISSRQLRRWAKRYQPEIGQNSLENKSRRPKGSPRETPLSIKEALTRHWKGGRITSFCRDFNRRYRRLLKKEGIGSLSRKTITRILKREGLYHPCSTSRPKPKKGVFHYLAPLAQGMIDTCHLKLFGVKLYLITLLDAYSRAILSQGIFLREVSINVKKVIKKALSRYPSLKSILSDWGRPYRAKEIKRYLDEKGVLRILAAPFRPQSKGVIERYFRTCKDYLKEIFSGFEGRMLPFPLLLRKILALVFGIGVLWHFSRKYTRGIQPGIDSKTPEARLKERVSLSDPEVLKKLNRLAERHLPKRELISELKEYFGFKESVTKMKKALLSHSLKALKESRRRLEVIRTKEGALSPKVNFRYFLGILRNVEEEIKIRKRDEKVREREGMRALKEINEAIAEGEASRKYQEEHPEKVIYDSISNYLLCLGVTGQFGRGHYERRITEDMERIYQKSPEGFSWEMVRVKRYLEVSGDNHKAEVFRFIEDTAAEILGRNTEEVKEKPLAHISGISC